MKDKNQQVDTLIINKTKHGTLLPCFVLSSCDSTNTVARKLVGNFDINLSKGTFSTDVCIDNLPNTDNISPCHPTDDGLLCDCFDLSTSSDDGLLRDCFDLSTSSDGTFKTNPFPFAVISQTQTAGRGRFDRKFLSQFGKGAFLTLATKVDSLSALSRLSCVAACAVCRVLGKYNVDCNIKWPNDILCGGKKICGILCTSSQYYQNGQSEGVQYALLGVGVNLNYDECDFGDLSDIATSLYLQKGATVDCVDFALSLACLLCDMSSLAQSGDIVAEYSSLCCTLGRSISFECDGKKISGTASKINDDMSLTVQTSQGQKTINFGEITHQ